ncbi:MAG: hypothetical protein ACQ9MH_26345 [Nitrospinales bacterium]
MSRNKIPERELVAQALQQTERKKEIRIEHKFEEIVEEIVNDCNAIGQILHETELSVSKDASHFLKKQS